MQKDLLEKIKRHGRPIAEKELHKEEREEARRLLAEGRLVYTAKKLLALPAWANMVRGRVSTTQRGAGFVIPDDGSKDIYIDEYCLNTARHGDVVLARREHTRGGRMRGTVLKVVERADSVLLGRFIRRSGKAYIYPIDSRIAPAAIRQDMDAQTGDLVVAKMVKYQPATADVTEVLGNAESPRAMVDGIAKKAGLPMEFEQDVLKLAAKLPDTVSCVPRGYADMRQDLCITIDGADARDLDDAVSVTKTENGYCLKVYIADVSNYVPMNGKLDDAAYERGTSVYFPDYVLPMLPEKLSNGICSLNAGVDRLALTCTILLDDWGNRLSYRFEKSVICVRERCVYEKVNAFFRDPKPQTDVEHMLLLMQELSDKLSERRHERGALDFDLVEGEIILDENGAVQDVRRHERGVGNRMIEEFMLAANECAAHLALAQELPFLYRVHEKPSEDDIRELFAMLDALGVPSPPNRTTITPKLLQKVIEQVRDTEYAVAVNRVLLRCMKKARYCEKNLGHFGLASRRYCHFTSPIRRYPDLMVHRAITAFLRGEDKMFQPPVAGMAVHTSVREKIAMDAERAVDDLKKAEYMQAHMEEEFKGIVVGVTEFGFFVELENTCEGLVRIQSMEDDRYEFDEKLIRLVGRHSGNAVSLGDKVEVQVLDADPQRGQITFALVRKITWGNTK